MGEVDQDDIVEVVAEWSWNDRIHSQHSIHQWVNLPEKQKNLFREHIKNGVLLLLVDKGCMKLVPGTGGTLARYEPLLPSVIRLKR